jgi:hypothetical protein
MDPKTKIRMQLLARKAELLAFAFCHKETSRFLLLPVEHFGTPAFAGAVSEAMKEGFLPLGAIALCSADDQPYITDERMPGASEKHMHAAKRLFEDDLLEKGVLKPDPNTTPIN